MDRDLFARKHARESERMPYRKSIVTFLDILGFRSVVGVRAYDQITAMLDAVGSIAASPAGGDKAKTKVLSFSDSVIRARPTEMDRSFDDLLQEVKDLAAAQWRLLELDILVRGGICIGDIAMEEARSFGPAFVRAYDLESSLAGAPRIVLDPEILETIRRRLKDEKTPRRKRDLITELKKHVRHGEDGLWYIDYIGSVARTTDDGPGMEASLSRVRDKIIEQANSFKANNPVLPKHLWLIRYFNERCAESYPKNRGLKIKGSDVPAADELLKPISRKRSKLRQSSADRRTG